MQLATLAILAITTAVSTAGFFHARKIGMGKRQAGLMLVTMASSWLAGLVIGLASASYMS